MALLACVVVTMAVSALVDSKGKFTMCHVQNSTLAGGVAIGTCANMPVKAWGAMTIGSIGGAISVIGYKYIADFLNNKLSIHDPAGVNNLHGLPGIFAGIAGAIMAAIATEDNFGIGLYKIFPAMASDGNSTDFDSLQQTFSWLQPGNNRTNLEQGCYQFAALVITIVISVIGGIITGFILRIPVLDNPGVDEIYDDRKYWNISESGFPAITEEGNNQNGVNDKTMRLLKANDTEEI